MATYFISDLHLCDQQPTITRSFKQFCQNKARNARALYILGDLFEYWMGDDAIDNTAQVVQAEIKSLTEEYGVHVFFMAGNRDFLLGDTFAQSCGMTLLEEPQVIDLYGQQVLLIHGDAECTDDTAYQKARIMLRNPDWQNEFLSWPLQKRIEFAQQAREQSKTHTQEASMAIMDVNQSAINNLFATHAVNTMIHGHTHRPAIHNNESLKRIVLGDWHHQTSYLIVDQQQMQLVCE